MMLSSMYFSWIIKQIFKVEPEPGQSDGSGSGSSQIPRLAPGGSGSETQVLDETDSTQCWV